MALWVCADCSTKYSVGADKCPQCGSKNYAEDGAPRPTDTPKKEAPKK